MATTTATRTAKPSCDPATAVTRSLLSYGVIAGPFYITVSLAQALTRDGFDLTRHSWSLLSNRLARMDPGRELPCHRSHGHRWRGRGASRAWHRPGRDLGAAAAAAFGVGMIGDAFLKADPAMGFPVGTPDGVGEVSWHGVAHLAVGGVGFLCLIAACFALARRFAAEGRRGWSAYSIVAGIVFFGGFVGIASGAGSTATIVTFVGAVLFVLTWLSAVSVHLYRRVR